MSEKLRVGFVGCGGITEEHLKVLIKRPDVAPVGFCDINLERARDIAKRYGKNGQAFDDAKSMFDKVQPQAVYFCLPPFAHGAELEAVKRGVPFFVEKPIDLYLKRAKEIAAAVQKRNLITSVGYMTRYRKGVQKVRSLLRDDPAILVLGGWITGTPDPQDPLIQSWFPIKEKSGGQFHEQVTHDVDLVRFLCGEVTQVQAFSAKGLNKRIPPNYNIEDASVVNLKLSNGAVANLWSCCSANASGVDIHLNVYANNMTAIFTGWEHSVHLFRAGPKPSPRRFRLFRAGPKPEIIEGEPDIFAIEDNIFIEAVRLNDPSKIECSYSDGLKTLEVNLAANESMETGKPVTLH